MSLEPNLQYNKLFNLIGLDDAWQEENRSRIELFLDRIYCRTQAEIDHAVARTTSQYDTSLEGVRMLLSVCARETIDWVLAKDECEIVINYGRPVLGLIDQGFCNAERRINEKVGYKKFYARGVAEIFSEMILGTCFDKTDWLIEISEDCGQTAGKGHCSEFQIWQGAIMKGVFPIPDVEIQCGIFCDQAPEADCLIASELHRQGKKGYRLIASDATLDHQWQTWPDIDPEGVTYMAETLERVYKILNDDYGFDVSEDDLLEGMADDNRMSGGYLRMAGLMSKADPQPIRQSDMGLTFYVWAMGTYYVDDAVAGCKKLEREMRQRIRDGVGVTPKGAPRIYTTYRYTADMSVSNLIEDVGFNHCLSWFDSFPPEVFDTPTKLPDHPSWLAFETMFRFMALGDNWGTVKSWAWMCKEHNLDGFIHLMTMFCRPYCLPTMICRDYVQNECDGIPYLVLEADGFDSRNYNPEQYRTRLESFYEVLKMNKMMKEYEEAQA